MADAWWSGSRICHDKFGAWRCLVGRRVAGGERFFGRFIDEGVLVSVKNLLFCLQPVIQRRARLMTSLLSLFPCARFRKRKAAVKMHTLLNLHGISPHTLTIRSSSNNCLSTRKQSGYER